MTASLAKRLDDLIYSALDDYPGSFIVWCDPRGDWSPLLRRVAEDTGGQRFTLLEIDEKTQDVLSGPVTRRTLQERIEAGHSFILLVTAGPNTLGWLWGQALLAERIYDGPCWRTDEWRWVRERGCPLRMHGRRCAGESAPDRACAGARGGAAEAEQKRRAVMDRLRS